MSPLVVWIVLLAAEAIVLYLGQRRLFGLTWQASGSKFVAYALAAPGTVLHEGAHWLACKLLGVQVGRVELFRPRQLEDGSITLGFVEHARAGVVRGTLVSIAPVLLVPPLLLAALYALLGGQLLEDPLAAFWQAPLWAKGVAVYLLVSAASAAFPSAGDEVTLGGLLLLIGAVIAALTLIDLETLQETLRLAALVAAPAAAAAALQLWLLDRHVSRR